MLQCTNNAMFFNIGTTARHRTTRRASRPARRLRDAHTGSQGRQEGQREEKLTIC